MEIEKNAQVIHDINSSIQALLGALEVVQDEWKTNPELTEKILPLAFDKLNQLSLQLSEYKNKTL